MRAVELEESVAQRFGSIDSHYLMFYLQYGYVGVSLFVMLMIVVLYYSVCAAWDDKQRWCTLCGGLAGAFLALALLMTSVWFAPDYGAVWLFNAGLIANIRSLPGTSSNQKKTLTDQTTAEARPDPLRRRLIPVTQV